MSEHPAMTPAQLAEKLDGLGKGMKDSLDGIRLQVEQLDGSQKEVLADLKRQEDWIKEVEATAAKARHGLDAGDNYKAVIPEDHRYLIRHAEIARAQKGDTIRRGSMWEDPVKAAAIALWAQMQLLKDPRVRQIMGREDKAAEDREVLAKLSDVFQTKATNPMIGASTFGLETIPTPLEAEVLRQLEDASIVRGMARKIAMTTRTHDIPDLTTGISVAIVAENTAGTNVRPVFGQKQLTALKYMALGAATIEVIQDSAIGLIDFWLTLANEQLGLKEDNEALEGNGTNHTGVLNATGVNSDDLGSPAAISATNYTNFVDTKYAAGKRASRAKRYGAAWICHPFVARDMEKLKGTDNHPILRNSQNLLGISIPEGADGSFLDYPLYTTEQIAINRGVGTNETAVYFGPWRRSMIFGDLMGIQFGTSEHTGWTDATIGLRMLKRTAILVAVPEDFSFMDRVQIAP